MIVEFLGFLAGISLVSAAILLLIRHERRRALEVAEGRKLPVGRNGNALIWPSH